MIGHASQSVYGRPWHMLANSRARCLPWLSRRKPVFHLPLDCGLCRHEKAAKTARAARAARAARTARAAIAVPSLCFFPPQTPQRPCTGFLLLVHACFPQSLGVGHRPLCIHSRIPLTTTWISRCIFPTVLCPPPPSFKGALQSDLPGIQIRGTRERTELP